jgi:hypothetical protein
MLSAEGKGDEAVELVEMALSRSASLSFMDPLFIIIIDIFSVLMRFWLVCMEAYIV